MPSAPSRPKASPLKDLLESEIKKEEQREVGLEVATRILKIRNVDKEYENLKDRTQATLFKSAPRNSKSHGLRPYQETAIAELQKLVRQKHPLIALQLPTGAGKTFLIHTFLYKRFLQKGMNVLIVTPSWEIAHQHAYTLCQQFKDGDRRVRRLGGRGQLIAGFPEFSKGMKGKIILTTSALFFARKTILQELLKTSLVVIDESHHGWKKMRLNSVLSFARTRAVPAILLTATPPRTMEKLPFAAQLEYLDLVPEYLVKCQVIRLETGQKFDPVFKNGALVNSSRVEISSRRKRYEKIVSDSIPHIKGQAIYFAGSVREAMGVLEEFSKSGMTSVVVHSKWATKGDKINALAIEKFRNGDAQVLVNVQMLAMGFDVPFVETIIVARPVESDTLFTQMVGRAARPAEGKDKFILIDVHDTIFKPEVAKIFEHKHVFYAGQELQPPPEILPLPEEEGIPLDIFPLQAPLHPLLLNDLSLAPDEFPMGYIPGHPLNLYHRNVVVDYFIQAKGGSEHGLFIH